MKGEGTRSKQFSHGFVTPLVILSALAKFCAANWPPDEK